MLPTETIVKILREYDEEFFYVSRSLSKDVRATSLQYIYENELLSPVKTEEIDENSLIATCFYRDASDRRSDAYIVSCIIHRNDIVYMTYKVFISDDFSHEYSFGYDVNLVVYSKDKRPTIAMVDKYIFGTFQERDGFLIVGTRDTESYKLCNTITTKKVLLNRLETMFNYDVNYRRFDDLTSTIQSNYNKKYPFYRLFDMMAEGIELEPVELKKQYSIFGDDVRKDEDEITDYLEQFQVEKYVSDITGNIYNYNISEVITSDEEAQIVNAVISTLNDSI